MFENLLERKKNLQVIRDGIHSDFWKTIKKDFERISALESKRAIAFFNAGNMDAGKQSSAIASALDFIIQNPEKFVRSYDPNVNNFILDFCEKCGNLFKNKKEKTVNPSFKNETSRIYERK